MSFRTAQRLVSAQRASHVPTRQLHSLRGLSTKTAPLSRRRYFSRRVDPHETSSFNLWTQIREARPAVRYTVYAGLGLMATVETTFWFNVIRAKYFSSKVAKEQERAEQLMRNLSSAVKGYRAVWLQNYGRYYGAYIWGTGYGGLDGID